MNGNGVEYQAQALTHRVPSPRRWLKLVSADMGSKSNSFFLRKKRGFAVFNGQIQYAVDQ